MTDTKLLLIELLLRAIPDLTAGQLHWLQRVVAVFGAEHHFSLSNSDLFDETTLLNFGDAMRVSSQFFGRTFQQRQV